MVNIYDIQDGVLVHCTVNYPRVTIPKSVKVIKSDAFDRSAHITSVLIPASVELIESYAFAYCEHLRKVTILGPADIESSAFISCHNLKEVYLADGVKSLGSECFGFCEQLHELYIPESVAYVGREIACMNGPEYRYPLFQCHRAGIGEQWNDDWNLIWHDSQFGNDKRHSFYHPTYYHSTREGEEPTDQQPPVLVTDMPHGTGVKEEDSDDENRTNSVAMPPITLRLWLQATRITFTGKTEYQISPAERAMLPRLIRNPNDRSGILRELDKPWEITVNQETYELAPEVRIRAWFNKTRFPFDGETMTICHDMPWRKDPWDDAALSRLKKGETVIAEQHIANGNFMDIYDVRLFIQWPG